MGASRMRCWRFTLFAVLTLLLATAHSAPEPVRIGVLAKRGTEQTLAQWQPTADYLSEVIADHRFAIVPVDFDHIYEAVSRREIDFILTNSGIYIELEMHHGASRIATLVNRGPTNEAYTRFGGVIFTRQSDNTIRQMTDLAGRRFAAVESNSLGGFLMAVRELHDAGIDIADDIPEHYFAGTHDQVVYDVLEGRADAGTVRTDTLERMALEGKIDIDSVRIINAQTFPGFAYKISTRLYPEWPMAKLAHTPAEHGDHVAAALLNMPPDHPAAVSGKNHGWTVPGNYQAVRELMQTLRIGPYKTLGKISIQDLMIQYGNWVIATGAFLLLLVGSSIFIGQINRRLRLTEKELRDARDHLAEKVAERTHELEESNRRLRLVYRDWNDAFDAITHPIFIHDQQLNIVHANPAYLQRAGVSMEYARGKPYWTIFPRLDGALPSCHHFPDASSNEGEEIHLADGSVLISRSFGIKNANGEYRHAIHILEDTTELRRTERHRHTLSLAVEQASEGVVIINNEGIVMFNNRAFVHMLAIEEEPVTGMPLELLLEAFDLPQSLEQILIAADKEGGWNHNITIHRPDSELPALMSANAIYDPDGHQNGYILTLVDMSEIRQAERALQYRIRYETLLGSLTATFLAAKGETINQHIDEALQRIGEFANVDRVFLFSFNLDEKQIETGYCWYNAASAPPCSRIEQQGIADCKWAIDQLSRQEIIRIGDVTQLPDAAAPMKTHLQTHGTRASVLVPLSNNDALIGFIGFDDVHNARAWSDDEIHLLRSAGGIIENAISRYNAEQAVRHSQASLAEAQHIAHLGNWEWDIANNTLMWSDEIYRIFGVEPQEFGATYDAFLNYVHEEDRDDVIEAVNRAITNQAPYKIDHRIVWSNGIIRIVHEKGSVTFDETGKAIHMIGTVQDVTDSRRRESELSRLNLTLRTLSLGNAALVHAQSEMELLERICHVLVDDGGYPFAAVLYQQNETLIREIDAGEDNELIAEILNNASRDDPVHRSISHSKTTLERNIRNQSEGWRKRFVENGYRSIISLPLINNDQVLGTLVILQPNADAFDDREIALLQELTDDVAYGIRALRERELRETAQHALEESEHRYHNLYDTAPTGYAAIDADSGKILQCNPAFALIFDQSKESITGQSFPSLLQHDGSTLDIDTIMNQLASGDGIRNSELKIGTKQSDHIWINLNIDPVFDKNGAVIEGRISINDISDRMAAEDQRRRFAVQMETALLQTIQAIALTIEKRDPYTAGHQQRVADLATAIGRHMQLDEHRMEGLRLGGMIHDIGKVYVPTEILNRPGKLDEAQFLLIKNHPQIGYDIIKGIDFPWPLSQMVLQHHERLDGSGYPNRLQGEEITLEARILAVADVIEAMASHRPYRPALSLEVALEEIENHKGNWFDSNVVDACRYLFDSGEMEWLKQVRSLN